MLTQLAVDITLLCVSKLIFCLLLRHALCLFLRHALYFVSTRHVVGVLSIVYFSVRCLQAFLLDSKGSLENLLIIILSHFTDMFLIVHVVLYIDMYLYFALYSFKYFHKYTCH